MWGRFTKSGLQLESVLQEPLRTDVCKTRVSAVAFLVSSHSWTTDSVLYCPVCLAPEGSWYPLTSPGKFFLGVKRVPAVGATATRTTCHGLLSSLHRHGLRCLFRSGGPHPVFLSMSVLRGLQSAHPPSPVELLRRGTRLLGGGSNVSPLSCVSCVPASCVLIWFISCPC